MIWNSLLTYSCGVNIFFFCPIYSNLWSLDFIFLLSCSFGQIWDLASGVLKLTLTGHIEQVRGEKPRYKYLIVVEIIVNWDNTNSMLSLQALLLATNILTCFLLVTINKLNVGILNRTRSNPYFSDCFSGEYFRNYWTH
jgi:hypothetical protein